MSAFHFLYKNWQTEFRGYETHVTIL